MILRCPRCYNLVAVGQDINGECSGCGELYTWYNNGRIVWGPEVNEEPQDNDLIEFILLILSGILVITYFSFCY